MTKQLTSAEAAALIYGKPGTKVRDVNGNEVSVNDEGHLVRNDLASSGALRPCWAPFTLPDDPDELPEDVRANLPIGDHIPPRTDQIMPALEALWRHIKPEAKR